MGLFDRVDGSFNNLVARAKINNSYFAQELSRINLESYREKFNDDKILGNILYDISDYGWELEKSLNNILTVYKDIVKKGTTEEKLLFKNVYDFLNENIYDNSSNWDISYYMQLSSAFDNKELVLEALNQIKQQFNLENFSVDNQDNLAKLISYPFKARMYYLDDRSLLSSFGELLRTNGLVDYLYSDNDINRVINRKIKEDRKRDGIYDVDRGTLAEINRKLDMINEESSKLQILINTATSIIAEIKAQVKMSRDELTDMKIKSLEELQIKANKILEDFNAKYLELLSEEKDSINNQKVELFAELQRELSKKKEELKMIVKQIGSAVEVQLGRINAASDVSVEKLEEYINSNERIKELIESTKQSDSYLQGLKVLSEHVATSPQDGDVPTTRIITSPTILIPQERIVDGKVNYFFDSRIPFEERFDKFLQIKDKLESQGEIFHEKFDDVAKFVMKGRAPYLYGPSGCGKTYMVNNQLAGILNANVVTNGYVIYEQDILGYTNSATGQYVPGNFYRCYKYGDIIFLDELDNGVANATVVLNGFTGGNNTSYTFPDGLNTKRHPNFRMIAAGNTNGSGRTVAHNTRQKMDESVMQRLKAVECGYDNRIEDRILVDYQDWLNFVKQFRKAVENISTISGEPNTIGIFTTRDAEELKEDLEDNSFDMEKLLQYYFIQTKDVDTLNSIYTYLNNRKRSEYNDGAEKILRKFNNMVEPRIKRR